VPASDTVSEGINVFELGEMFNGEKGGKKGDRRRDASTSSGKVVTIRFRKMCVRPGGRIASEAAEFSSQITIENENHGKNPRNGSTQ